MMNKVVGGLDKVARSKLGFSGKKKKKKQALFFSVKN
jgi:hypothetical protein